MNETRLLAGRCSLTSKVALQVAAVASPELTTSGYVNGTYSNDSIVGALVGLKVGLEGVIEGELDGSFVGDSVGLEEIVGDVVGPTSSLVGWVLGAAEG